MKVGVKDIVVGAALMTAGLLVDRPVSAQDHGAFISRFSSFTPVGSTVPQNGDVNPYGVAVVQRSVGALVRDHVLVSNFNNSQNQQGTGITVVDLAPDGTMGLFAQIASAAPFECPGGIGLTTALTVLRTGWVIVGSLPTADGTSATAQAGCLLVLDSHGQLVRTIHGGLINGPWDMTAFDEGDEAVLFVANVLNGTVAANGNTVNEGTIVRVRLSFEDSHVPRVQSEAEIGSQFAERTDPDALVIGPTGLGLGRDGVLYVADTASNRVAAIPRALTRFFSAGPGETVSSGGALNAPLGLAVAPNGHVIVVNGDDGNVIEIDPRGGAQVSVVDSGFGAGALFGLAMAPERAGIYLVNDGDNTLQLFH
jgi:hypothetical protein